jgi:hypothetical protein
VGFQRDTKAWSRAFGSPASSDAARERIFVVFPGIRAKMNSAMFRAFFLIFKPLRAWERIYQAQRGILFIFFVHLLPLLVLVSAAEGFGLVHFGKWRGAIPRLQQFPVGEAVIFEAAQVLIGIVLVLTGTLLVKALGETFHGRHTCTQAFTVVAFGLSPLFLMRLLDTFSGISPWVSWAVGILFSASVLYHGVPRIMDPDPPHAFGLFLMTTILLTLTSGLARLLTTFYLQGKFPQIEAWVASVAAGLPL